MRSEISESIRTEGDRGNNFHAYTYIPYHTEYILHILDRLLVLDTTLYGVTDFCIPPSDTTGSGVVRSTTYHPIAVTVKARLGFS